MVKVTDANLSMLSSDIVSADSHPSSSSSSSSSSSDHSSEQIAIPEIYYLPYPDLYCNMVKYHKCKALTWVAFVANKPWLDSSKIDKESIEMYASMITSEHARFTSHVGIERAGAYTGEVYKDLANRLHSFIAKATLEHYPDKLYMIINTPINAMRPIIVNEFYKQEKFNDVFMGYEVPDPIYMRSSGYLHSQIEKSRTDLASESKTLESRGLNFWQSTKCINRLIQEKHLTEHPITTPPLTVTVTVTVTVTKAGTNLYTIYDQKGQKLHEFNQRANTEKYLWLNSYDQMINGEEYAWLNSYGCLLSGDGDNLLTCKLEGLANLAGSTGVLDHAPESEIIGDASQSTH